ncbi:hypothetical protein Hanom_Chr04g00316251 [Helianthus anomalus]
MISFTLNTFPSLSSGMSRVGNTSITASAYCFCGSAFVIIIMSSLQIINIKQVKRA